MITVEYTLQELQALTALIDMAVKANGLQVAAGATFLNNKHEAAAKAYQEAQEAKQAETPETQEG